MPKSEEKETKNQPPPPGYPGKTPGGKCCPRFKRKGERGFIEGCLFALCCCWLCEECF